MSGFESVGIYLLLAALELLAPEQALLADYLQDGTPIAQVAVSELSATERDLYQMEIRPPTVSQSANGVVATTGADEQVPVTRYRVEQSDLISTNYLVYGPDGAPELFSLAPFLEALVGVATLDFRIFLGSDENGLLPDGLSGQLVVLSRDPYLILSNPESGIVLIVERSP